jgi:membrane-associated phospholipid phosphatase
MHIGFAVISGLAIFALARSRVLRIAGALYPAFVLFVIVATGNHFFFDALAGALVAAVAVTALQLRRTVRRPRATVSAH